jgi:lipopolysaccharide export system protein LptC
LRAWTGAGFPLAILLALGALTLWLKHAAELPDEKPIDKRRHDPDTIIEQFTASTMDSQGRPLHQLAADKLVHYADDDSSELLNPHLRYTPPGEPTITLLAKHGKMLNGKEEVRLFDDVRIERQGTPSEPGWQATTPELTAFPALGTAHTESPIVFTQGAAKLDGTGFSLDQKARTVELHATVRGHFPPRAPTPQ